MTRTVKSAVGSIDSRREGTETVGYRLTVAPASASVNVGATHHVADLYSKTYGASDKAISVHSTDPQRQPL